STPERDEVWFNGHLVPGSYLQGYPYEGLDPVIFGWYISKFKIPVEWVNFATKTANDLSTEAPEPGHNEIRVKVDVLHYGWDTVVSWVHLQVHAARPYL